MLRMHCLLHHMETHASQDSTVRAHPRLWLQVASPCAMLCPALITQQLVVVVSPLIGAPASMPVPYVCSIFDMIQTCLLCMRMQLKDCYKPCLPFLKLCLQQ